jgi:hypothetical protein
LPSIRPVPLLCLLLAPLPLAAQDGAGVAERVVAAASIPALAGEVRSAGVSEDELGALLDALADGRVPGPDARVVLEEEAKAAKRDGPVSGIGSFVQSQLASGVRGRALADAIRAEHGKRGRAQPVKEPVR